MANRLSTLVAKVQGFPPVLRKFLLSKAFGRVVPFFGTAKIRIETLTHEEVVMTVANKRRVQNHLKTVHAVAMTLLAESATGIVMGMNVPDDKYLVIKRYSVDFQKAAKGDMKAVARLSPEQVRAAQQDPEGEFAVEVHIYDGANVEPIQCEMLWAWRPRRK